MLKITTGISMKIFTLKISLPILILNGIHFSHTMQEPISVKVNNVYLGEWENETERNVTLRTYFAKYWFAKEEQQNPILKTLKPGEHRALNIEVPLNKDEYSSKWYLSEKNYFSFEIEEKSKENTLEYVYKRNPMLRQDKAKFNFNSKFAGKIIDIFINGKIVPNTKGTHVYISATIISETLRETLHLY